MPNFFFACFLSAVYYLLQKPILLPQLLSSNLEVPQCLKLQTSVGLVHRLHSDINPGINMSMKISNRFGMVCSSYCIWDHFAMVCENRIPQLILDSTSNNILGTLIYIHAQLFINTDAMVWVLTFLGCKVWVVNCKLCCSLAWWEVVTS